MHRASLMVVVVLCGCPRPPPAPLEEKPRPPPPPAVKIPPGCEAALTGEWTHQTDPTFRCRIEDDTADATVFVYRAFPETDGGRPPAGAVIHLRRTPKGFVGQTEMTHVLPSGHECQATFPTEVTGCTPSTLTLLAAASTPVGEGCQTPPSPQPAAMLEHRLARTDAGAL